MRCSSHDFIPFRNVLFASRTIKLFLSVFGCLRGPQTFCLLGLLRLHYTHSSTHYFVGVIHFFPVFSFDAFVEQGGKITCPAFGLFSSPAEYSTMGHNVLGQSYISIRLQLNRLIDLVTHRDMYSSPCESENQHIRLMHETCMKMKMRMTNLWYVRQQEKNRTKKDVIKTLMTKTLHLWFLRDLRDLLKPHSDRR